MNGTQANRSRLRVVLVVACALVAGVEGAAMSATAPAAVAASGPAPGLDDDWTQDARRHLGSVPRELRPTCTVSGPSAVAGVDEAVLDEARGELSCSAAGGAITVTYTKFTSAEAATTYQDQTAKPEATRDMAEEPGDCPTQFRIERDRQDVGRYTCFLAAADDDFDAGTPVITWTYEPLAMVVQAYDTDLDLARLRKFWSDDAGPLSEPDMKGVPPLPTAASLRANGKKLLAEVPAASRRGCKVINSLTPDALGEAFVWRLWIVADVEECRPERGSTDTEYMQLATAGATDAFMSVLPESYASDQRITVGGTKCAGTGPYDDAGRRAGRYMCWFSTDDTDAQASADEFAHLRFSDIRNRVVVSGGAPATKVEALLSWWKDDARLG